MKYLMNCVSKLLIYSGVVIKEITIGMAYRLIEPGPVILVATNDGKKNNITTISSNIVMGWCAPSFIKVPAAKIHKNFMINTGGLEIQNIQVICFLLDNEDINQAAIKHFDDFIAYKKYVNCSVFRFIR